MKGKVSEKEEIGTKKLNLNSKAKEVFLMQI